MRKKPVNCSFRGEKKMDAESLEVRKELLTVIQVVQKVTITKDQICGYQPVMRC